MALVTVVEAAGLSGLPPERIRALIETGQLTAQAVPLDHGPVYLVESAQIESIVSPPSTPAARRVAATPSRDPLVDALAGLRAALVRRRLLAERASDDDEDTSPRPAPPRRRLSNGLPDGELRALAARVDRLLGP